MESVMAAAARYDLGALLDSWPTGTRRIARAKEICHRFEHGLVVDTRRGPLAFPYSDLRIYRAPSPFSRQHEHLTDWTFERGDGQAWQTSQRELRKKELALAQIYKEALAQTCARQREAAVQRLGEGATLAFGPVELDRSQIVFDGVRWGGLRKSGLRESVSWTRVIKFEVTRDIPQLLWIRAIREGHSDEGNHSVGSVAEIPNFPLLWELVHLAHANAQAAG